MVADEHLIVRERCNFAEAMLELLAAPAVGESLAQRARDLVRRIYDWHSVGHSACNAIKTAIGTRSP